LQTKSALQHTDYHSGKANSASTDAITRDYSQNSSDD